VRRRIVRRCDERHYQGRSARASGRTGVDWPRSRAAPLPRKTTRGPLRIGSRPGVRARIAVRIFRRQRSCCRHSAAIQTPALPRAILLGISGTGDMALSLNARFLDLGVPIGTLAQAPVSGGSPRELTRDVTYAEWSPDGSAMAIVRREGSRTRLEFPSGKALY